MMSKKYCLIVIFCLTMMFIPCFAGSQTTTIFEDTFESSSYLTTRWNVIGDPFWLDSSSRSYSGTWSAYCAGSDTGAPPCPIGMDTWMIYGPFSLSDAIGGGVNFRVWHSIFGDAFEWVVSLNDVNYYGYIVEDGNSSWGIKSLDFTNIPTLGDITGESQVWFAFRFGSDSIGTALEGVYIDDVVINKIVYVADPPPLPSTSDDDDDDEGGCAISKSTNVLSMFLLIGLCCLVIRMSKHIFVS